MSESDRKLGELLLYVSQQLADEPSAGSIKINKLLYFAEQTHMRTTGRPITGADYQRLEHGPAPRRLVPVRDHSSSKATRRSTSRSSSGGCNIASWPVGPPS